MFALATYLGWRIEAIQQWHRPKVGVTGSQLGVIVHQGSNTVRQMLRTL